MPRTCTICRHPGRQEIEIALLKGEAYRTIADRTGTKKTSLIRHRKQHLNPLRRTRTPTEGRSTLLTPDLQNTIVETIRKGSFDWVAARTAGITPQTFQGWLRKGEGEVFDPIYTPFAIEVRRAQAEARSGAEIAVRKDLPLAWLRYGPGRDRPGEPGWTDSTEVTNRYDKQAPAFILVLNGTTANHRPVIDTHAADGARESGPLALDRGRDEDGEDNGPVPLDR